MVFPRAVNPVPEVLYAAATEAGELMVITADPHSCGWPERISYLDAGGRVVRSGCAGCEAERPVPAGKENDE